MRHRCPEPCDGRPGGVPAPPPRPQDPRHGGALPLSAPGVVRCPRCGAEASDDAAWCPQCGKPFELELLDLGGTDEPPPVVETGRDRRPLVIAALVVAVLLGGLVLTSGASPEEDDEDTAAEPSSTSSAPTSTSAARRSTSSTARRSTTTTLPPPISPEPLGVRFAVLGAGQLVLVDVDANRTTQWEAAPVDLSNRGGPLVGSPAIVRDGVLVFQGDDGAWAMPLQEGAVAKPVAPSLLLFPAANGRDIWSVEVVDGRPVAQRRRPDGAPTSEPHPLPADWTPLAEVDVGLVLRRPGQFQVWDPARGATVHESPDGASVVAAAGRLVVWQAGCEAPLCSLHITDVVTGADRTIFLGRTSVDYGFGSFSPDGRRVAFRGYEIPSSNAWRPGVIVVDLTEGTASFERADALDQGTNVIEWSPDSRWLLLMPAAGASETDVVAYSPERDSTVELNLPRGAGGFWLVAY